MVYILLADGFEEMEALVPADILRRAGVDVALMGLDTPVITGGHGISLSTDCLLNNVELHREDTLVLPGGMGGVNSMQASPAALSFIHKAHDLGCRLAAICAAPTLLARLGLLDGRKAVCYPGMEGELTGAEVVDAPVVVDGSLVTARAAGSAYEFGFTLAALLGSPEKSEEVRHGIHYRP